MNRVVGSGVDTLVLWTAHPVSVPVELALAEAQKGARESGQRVSYQLEGHTFEVSDHGVKGARFFAEALDCFALKVQPRTSNGSPTVTLELRSQFLWANGWAKAAERAIAILRAVCGDCEESHLEVQVARIDLAVDFQPVGWAPSPDLADSFVGRVRKATRGRHWSVAPDKWFENESELAGEVGRVVAVAKRLAAATSQAERRSLLLELHGDEGGAQLSVYGDALAFSGFSWGRGAIGARLYDKTRELSVSRKGWFRTVWARTPGYDPEGAVWRLEYQLRREGLRQFREASKEAGTEYSAGSWRDIRHGLDALWRYLSRHWLSARDARSSDDRRTYSAWWVELQSGWQCGDGESVDLFRQTLSDARSVVTPALAGYVSTAVAQVQAERHSTGEEPLPYFRAVIAALRAAHDYRETKGETVRHRSEHRTARLVAKKATLEGHSTARAALVRAARCGGRKARHTEGVRYAPVRLKTPGAGSEVIPGMVRELTDKEMGA